MATPTGILFNDPRAKPTSAAGLAQPGAYYQYYLTQTTTLANVYKDGALTQAAVQTPGTGDTTLAGDGRMIPIYLNPNSIYRVQLYSAIGALLEDTDPYVVPAGAQLYPQTAAELNAGVTPTNFTYAPGNVLRYGIVANSSAAATANTTAFRAVYSATVYTGAGGPTGSIVFPNLGGNDTYFFNNIIDFRDGCHIDLNGSTLQFTASGTDVTKQDAGFLYAVRDFSCENGFINVNYPTGGVNQGHAIAIGSRTTAGSTPYFVNYFDSTLPSPQGNVKLRNLRVTSNQPLALLLWMTGGLRNLVVENCDFDGQSVVLQLIYGEYGFATGGTNNLRQSSHGHNLHFKNVRCVNSAAAGTGNFGYNGAYCITLENFYANGGNQAIQYGSGESLFYRPWTGVDQGGALTPPQDGRVLTLKNITCINQTGTPIEIDGANTLGTGYLGSLITGLGHPADYIAYTDLCEVSIDGLLIEDATGFGIKSSAHRLTVANGRIRRCQRGIVTTNECTFFDISNLTINDNTDLGVQIGIGFPVWSPSRLSIGQIRNCFIAGNGTAGTADGIDLLATAAVLIESCRFGYEVAHDGVAEAHQTFGVNAGSTAAGVVIRGCYGGGVVSGNMYNKITGPAGCSIVQGTGITTQQGTWQSYNNLRQSVAYSASMTPDCAQGNLFLITATNATAFTINAPLSPPNDGLIYLTIKNTSGGALGVATFNAIFKLAAWTQPATGFSRSIAFRFDGTNWIEESRTPVDVPN